MSEKPKNPFGVETPEYQLFENATSNDSLVRSYTADVERYEGLRKKAREKAEAYWDAIEKLTGKDFRK